MCLLVCVVSLFWVQGFASLSDKVTTGATVWSINHLPQNREISMLGAGDGTLYLYKYHYPDQRKVKVRLLGEDLCPIPALFASCTLHCVCSWPSCAVASQGGF